MQTDLLITNATVVTCASPNGPKRQAAMRDVGIIHDGAVAIDGDTILATGPSETLTASYSARQTLDAGGQVVCPGFVDPHTHVVYAGDRVAEFEQRIRGTSYMEIMQAGGGIVSTMRATRLAALAQLVAESRPRLDTMLALGTTTVEIKTGYGLDTESELKMLHAIARLAEDHACDLVPTFLAAHAVPPEYETDPNGYIDLVIKEMIPAAAAWFQNSQFATIVPAAQRSGVRNSPFFCDVFCEANVFSQAQARDVLQAGLAHGLSPKIHADEFESLGGVTLAVALGAISADHLDVTPPDEVTRLAGSNTIGVVLPAVNFNLGSRQFANARALIDAGVALALATDINPGSAPCPSMPLVMALACRYQRLLPAEALNASTINAAHAIGLGQRLGSLEAGKQADLLLLDTADYRHLAYQFGSNLVAQVIKKGKLL